MSDPYGVIGVDRGASFQEIRAAYRHACKTRHPDMGGSREALIELNAAYSFVLNEMKENYRRRTQEAPEQWAKEWSKRCREIDEELESVQRAAQEYEERFRAALRDSTPLGHLVRAQSPGPELNLARLLGGFAQHSLKWLATVFAALLTVGTLLVETNIVSAIVIIGSSIGFFFSLALKSDKGGFMSAGLLLFGIATIWMPSLRAALFNWPVATVSILLCLALVFKFSRDGGIAGLLTGGILAISLIGVILNETLERQSQTAASPPSSPSPSAGIASSKAPSPSPSNSVANAKTLTPTLSSPPPEPRELLAAQGSILKFADGVAYQLKLRSGMRTQLVASTGAIAMYRGSERISDCTPSIQVAAPTASGPYVNFDRLIRSCGGDAIFQVSQVW